jgi:hypothetical protein
MDRPICACGCGEFIPEERVRHEGPKRMPKFCNRDHMMRWRKESGWYSSTFSRLGMQAQVELAEKLGERPGNDKRRAVLDRVRNRSGRKTGNHKMSKPSYYGITMLEQKMVYTQKGVQQIIGNWFILSGPHADKDVAKKNGEEEVERLYPLNPVSPQLERATLLKNLTVVTKSELRQYRVEVDDHAEC